MAETHFIVRLLMTFAIGSLWIYLTIWASTRFGSHIGGFIGGLPSTSLISFFFIGYTQSTSVATEATTMFPLAIGVSGLFLVVFAALSKRGFFIGLFSGILVWLFLSFLINRLQPVHFGFNLFLYALIMTAAFLILEKGIGLKVREGKKENRGASHRILRSMFGGLIITLTVMIEKIGGPFLGGIFAAFPAMFIATLLGTYHAQGLEFTRSLTKPLLVTGMITVAVFAIGLRYLLIPAGLWLGMLSAILISGTSALLTYRFILPRIH